LIRTIDGAKSDNNLPSFYYALLEVGNEKIHNQKREISKLEVGNKKIQNA
jgi:hypothetical protein